MGSTIYYGLIPVVLVLVLLKICGISWRIWRAYRKPPAPTTRQQRRRTRHSSRQVGDQATPRVIYVEQRLGPEGFSQRATFQVNQSGRPVTILGSRDNRRPNDPNLPPSYDHAVTGQDKSVKVEEGKGVSMEMNQIILPGSTAPPPPPFTSTVLAPPPFASLHPSPPYTPGAPPCSFSGAPPPDYVARTCDSHDAGIEGSGMG